MGHFDIAGKPVEYGKLIAVRALTAVIHTSASGVGLPIQLWTITANGVKQIDEAEVRQLEELVGTWQQMEEETLVRLMSDEAEEESTPPPPDVSP